MISLFPLRCFLAMTLLAAAAGPSFSHELNEETFSQWRDYIRPESTELQWRRIPWRTIFWEAMQEANAANRPVLLWAMNGHPFGCT